MKTLTVKFPLVLVAAAVLTILAVQPAQAKEEAYRVVLEVTGLT